MKAFSICLVTSVVLLTSAARGQEESRLPATLEAQPQFLEPGEWWNLYFAEGNDPLKRGMASIKAVKVIKISKSHPSWVQIAFPKSDKEHFSIFGPAAKVHDDPSLEWETVITAWERDITEWEVKWINLQFVVHMSKVEPSQAREAADNAAANRATSPSPR